MPVQISRRFPLTVFLYALLTKQVPNALCNAHTGKYTIKQTAATPGVIWYKPYIQDNSYFGVFGISLIISRVPNNPRGGLLDETKKSALLRQIFLVICTIFYNSSKLTSENDGAGVSLNGFSPV
ncbi:MAG: hypothetical protein H6Q22_1469 [Bacteroidetes bacterium]|nr:hypothetical protein [Bacteroidota bacterium]